MFQIGYLIKRRAGTSLEQFREQYESGQVATSDLSLARGATRHTRKYLRPRKAGVDKESAAPKDSYDAFVELQFASRESYEQTLAKLDRNEIEAIKDAEAKLMDRAGRVAVVIDEHVSPVGDVRRDHLLHWRPEHDIPQVDASGRSLKGASLFKRKPGMSHEEFKRYYEEKHVLIGYQYVVYNATRYARKFLRPLRSVTADPFADAGQAAPTDTPYDVFMELNFESQAGRQRAVGSLTAADIDVITADEARFMDRGDRLAFEVDEPDQIR